jgi:hypothetical protein
MGAFEQLDAEASGTPAPTPQAAAQPTGAFEQLEAESSVPKAREVAPESAKESGNAVMDFLKKPSPEVLQKYVEKPVTATPPKEAIPMYWYGKGLEHAADHLPEGAMKNTVKGYAGALQGVSEVGAGMLSLGNVGLAVAAPEGIAGKAVAGLFLGQSLSGVPEEWTQLKAAYSKGDYTAVGEHMASMGARFLPAFGLRTSKSKIAAKKTATIEAKMADIRGQTGGDDAYAAIQNQIRQASALPAIQGKPPDILPEGQAPQGTTLTKSPSAQVGTDEAYMPPEMRVGTDAPKEVIPGEEKGQAKPADTPAVVGAEGQQEIPQQSQQQLGGGEPVEEKGRKSVPKETQKGAHQTLHGKTALGPGEGEATPPAPHDTTSLANAIVDEERRRRGQEPIMTKLRGSWAKSWDRAMQQVESERRLGKPHPADKLIEQLQRHPRAITPDEIALLLHRKVELRNHLGEIAVNSVRANHVGDVETINENNAMTADLMDKLNEIDEVGHGGGSALGQGLQAMKMSVADDFSLANLVIEHIAAKGGKLLNPAELDAASDFANEMQARQIALDAYETSPRAEAYWKQLKKLKQMYEDAYAQGKKLPKRMPLPLDQQHTELKFEISKLRDAWKKKMALERWKNATGWQRNMDRIVRWRRAFVISGPRSVLKLSSAMIEGQVVLPAREVLGGAIGQVPGFRRIAKMAPREGGLNIHVEAQAIAEMWRNLVSDFDKNRRGEKPDFEALYGNFQTLPPELQNYVGYWHSAIKGPLARNEFTRSFQKRLVHAMQIDPATGRTRVDVTFPPNMYEIGRQAWMDSTFWRFQNSNFATKTYRGLLSMMEKQKLSPKTGKIARRVLELELPVVTVPTNILARSMESVLGGFQGVGRAFWAHAITGVENLKPEQADLIMRNMKTGGLGSALMMIGFFLPAYFGGFYRKEKKEQLAPGEVPKPGFGVARIPFPTTRMTPHGIIDVPPWLQDNPFLLAIQMGATVRQVSDHYVTDKHKSLMTGLWHGFWTGLASQVQEQPFMREAQRTSGITQAFETEGGPGEKLGDWARDLTVPMLVQQTASMTDPEEKRYPEGFFQTIEGGIPYWRMQLPTEAEHKREMRVKARERAMERHLAGTRPTKPEP